MKPDKVNKKGKKNRAKYGYDHTDAYSLEYYLCSWLPNAIREIKDTNRPDRFTQKQWNKILEKMAQGFEAGYYLRTEPFDRKIWDKKHKIFKRGMKLFAENFFDLWY